MALSGGIVAGCTKLVCTVWTAHDDIKRESKRPPIWVISLMASAPTEIRTPVLALKGLRPGPLDDGGFYLSDGILPSPLDWVKHLFLFFGKLYLLNKKGRGYSKK